jgi:hypothetical protein
MPWNMSSRNIIQLSEKHTANDERAKREWRERFVFLPTSLVAVEGWLAVVGSVSSAISGSNGWTVVLVSEERDCRS